MKLLRRLWLLVMCLLAAMGLSAQQPNTVDNGSGSTSPAASLTVPRLIKFSGMLNDLTGKPLTGPVDVNFAIYKEQADLVPLWYEAQTLQLDEQGRYTVLLGAMQAEGLPMALFTSGEARWLEVAAAGAEPQPRTLLVSVPYALKAGDAETLGGKPASAFMPVSAESGAGQSVTTAVVVDTGLGASTLKRTTDGTPTPQLTSGTPGYIAKFTSEMELGDSVMYQSGSDVGIGTTNPQAPMHIYSSGSTNSTLPGFIFERPDSSSKTHFQHYFPGISYFSQNLYRDASGSGWYLDDTGTAGMGMIVSTNKSIETPNINFLYLPTGGATLPTKVMVIESSGNVGVGTANPQNTLDVFGAFRLRNWSGGSNGYVFAPASDNSVLTMGYQNPSSWYSQALSITYSGDVGIGTTGPAEKLEVAGNVKASGSVTASSFSGNGSGLTNLNTSYLIGAVSTTSSVGGVPGVSGTNTAGTGDTNGVYGLANSTEGMGVYGYASAGTGDTSGVYGLADSTDGTGVFGYASSSADGLTDGVYGEAASTKGAGVYGYAAADTGETYGVYGEAQSTSGTGVLGYAISATGTTVGVTGKAESSAGVAGLFDNLAGGDILIGQTNGTERFRVDGSGNVTASGSINGALRLETTAGAPNVVAGYLCSPDCGNRVTSGVQGATIGGGGFNLNTNSVTDDRGTVAGGSNNRAGDAAGTTSDKPYATVGGGNGNKATGSASVVGGGQFNTASGEQSAICGGSGNTASATNASVVGGGVGNTASGNSSSVVGGGSGNTASGDYSTVAGGSANTAVGAYSFAAGRRAKANHDGAFVWGDSTDADVVSTAANQFIVRASGGAIFSHGVRLNTTTAKPTCNASARGTFWLTQGGTGVKDSVQVCAKDASDSYAWRTIY